jgi:hypothetical protein
MFALALFMKALNFSSSSLLAAFFGLDTFAFFAGSFHLASFAVRPAAVRGILQRIVDECLNQRYLSCKYACVESPISDVHCMRICAEVILQSLCNGFLNDICLVNMLVLNSQFLMCTV